MKTYFWQAGSLPGVGAFPAGTLIETDDVTGVVLSITPGALAVPPIDSLPPPEDTSIPEVPLPSSSSRQAKQAPAFSPNGD